MNIIKKIHIGIVIVSLFVLPILVSAQAQPTTPPKTTKTVGIGIKNPFNCGVTSGTAGDCTIMTLIVAILNNIILPVVAVGIVIFIIYAGFMFVMAQGKATEIAAARQRLLWGLIGAGIILGAAGISKVVENTIRGFL